MKEKEIIVDPCYVIGTTLLYKNNVDRDLLNRVEIKLSRYYDIDLSPEKIAMSVEEWRDFFRFNIEEEVILTKEGLMNKNLIRFLFADGLEIDIYNNLVDAILNVPSKHKNKVRTKSINFPKL